MRGFRAERLSISASFCADELIELQMDGPRIPILRILNEEHHKKRENGGAGVNDELPGIREAEKGTRRSPENDDESSEHEGPRRPDFLARPVCDASEE